MMAVAVLRSGSLGALVRSHGPQRVLVALQTRDKSSSVREQVDRWDKANAIFYGPERDKVNFPHPVMRETGGKVRLGFIPEEWFQFFYPKTGVTGPYVFGAGLVTYLLSKEIWVVDHGFSEFLGFTGALLIIVKKLGPFISKFFDQATENQFEDYYVKPLRNAKTQYEQVIVDGEKRIWQEEGQKHLFEAKKENVDLQLEAVYRQRMKTVYDEVKKRLDYQLEKQSVQRRFEQDHMVNWIVESVKKSITPQQEKDSITKCIADLRALAKV